eukprot:13622297-Alexandrium_andersonii.AAC.1
MSPQSQQTPMVGLPSLPNTCTTHHTAFPPWSLLPKTTVDAKPGGCTMQGLHAHHAQRTQPLANFTKCHPHIFVPARTLACAGPRMHATTVPQTHAQCSSRLCSYTLLG